MTEDCKHSQLCGGGHTTAQHYIQVYERILELQCGIEAFRYIKEAVDRDAAKLTNLK